MLFTNLRINIFVSHPQNFWTTIAHIYDDKFVFFRVIIVQSIVPNRNFYQTTRAVHDIFSIFAPLYSKFVAFKNFIIFKSVDNFPIFPETKSEEFWSAQPEYFSLSIKISAENSWFISALSTQFSFLKMIFIFKFYKIWFWKNIFKFQKIRKWNNKIIFTMQEISSWRIFFFKIF